MYATSADLINKFGELQLAKLTNTDPNNDVPNGDRLALALEEATAEIDMYLGKCYVVPLTTVPAGIKFKAIALARYHLESGCDCSEKVQKQYEDAIKWLTEVCCGDCPPDIGIPKKSDRRDGLAYVTQPRVFDRHSLQGYSDPNFVYGDCGDHNCN
jgi:phage gp36-like protein